MNETLIAFVNRVLSLVGENQLATSNGYLGEQAKRSIQSAINYVFDAVRPRTHETVLTFDLTSTDFLTVGINLPSNLQCVTAVHLKSDQSLVKLPFLEQEQLESYTGVCVVGTTLFVSNTLARPVKVLVTGIVVPLLPANDSDIVNVDYRLIPAIELKAGSLIVSSFDDNQNSAILARMAEESIINVRPKLGAWSNHSSWSL